MKKFNINEIYKIAGKDEGGKGKGGDKGEDKDGVKGGEKAEVKENDNGADDKTGEESKTTAE